ncbi:hypothetical protein [Amycolatopsis regifaucium]|uniref:Uncharacterized protein n=1 Tax=Amycolatopsis regifaucium TaxID=546365 RepID=A0A154MGI5_9PSEU|nr:hypothetical protein [Amycolatopsis regifaucium]KZB83614.1 hypothetical protein AVL48_36045 [Amycolatopsis regifaucium]OKA03870.1 hypothetical protein ATP06_0234215 [Amycolatopsis regifaucium]SFJ65204.1 hypothetical protein SAMN04489731_1292 [Amycolatopsis regifaucium]
MKLRTTTAALSMILMASALAAPAHAARQTVFDDFRCTGPGSGLTTCISFVGTRNSYAAFARGAGYFGHVDLWGPGITFKQTGDENNPVIQGDGLGTGWLCAHGWAPVGSGHYVDMGFPCVFVP